MIYIHHHATTYQLGLPLYHLLTLLSVVTDRLASLHFIKRTFEDIHRNRAVKLSHCFFTFSELGSTFPLQNAN